MTYDETCGRLADMIKDEHEAQPAYEELGHELIRSDIIFFGTREKDFVELLIEQNKADEHKHEAMLVKLQDLLGCPV